MALHFPEKGRAIHGLPTGARLLVPRRWPEGAAGLVAAAARAGTAPRAAPRCIPAGPARATLGVPAVMVHPGRATLDAGAVHGGDDVLRQLRGHLDDGEGVADLDAPHLGAGDVRLAGNGPHQVPR